MRYLTFLLPCLLVACAHASGPESETSGRTASLEPAMAEDGLRPLYEPEQNWVVVANDGKDDDTVAVVTLARPELAGMMRLEIIRSRGRSPEDYADSMRERLDAADEFETGNVIGDPQPDGVIFADPDGFAGFQWRSQGADSAEDPTVGLIRVRRHPGRNDLLVLCEGWWPESSHTYLRAALHSSCLTVRLQP